MTAGGSDHPADGQRRRLLIGGAALVGVYGTVRYAIPAVSARLRGLDFAPLERPAGFRRLDGGASSSATFDPFFGLDPVIRPPEIKVSTAEVEARICDVLFDAAPQEGGPIPVAYFSDYNCPYCRVLSLRLAEMAAKSPERMRMVWHELPLLGDSSILSARAALAARNQGAYTAFHRRLIVSPFRTTPSYLEQLAADLGIDIDRLQADMDSSKIARTIAESRALADLFGFVGTPALVVGRTAVQGTLSETLLYRLIAREHADGPLAVCA